MLAGYVAVIVAASPMVAAWHAHADQALGPLYAPTTAFGSALVTVMSKSAIVINLPCGSLGVALPVESLSVSHTGPHPPIGSGFTVAVSATVHGALGELVCARA